MREIKFRAWCDNKMNDWSDLLHPFDSYGSDRTLLDHLMEDQFLEDRQLMQYTGLKDKNGKEIYEGDIVKCSNIFIDADFNYTEELCDEETGVVKWDKMLVGYSYKSGFPIAHKDVFEVIGNIYENPDLIA